MSDMSTVSYTGYVHKCKLVKYAKCKQAHTVNPTERHFSVQCRTVWHTPFEASPP